MPERRPNRRSLRGAGHDERLALGEHCSPQYCVTNRRGEMTSNKRGEMSIARLPNPGTDILPQVLQKTSPYSWSGRATTTYKRQLVARTVRSGMRHWLPGMSDA
jgi:hypothetical protein